MTSQFSLSQRTSGLLLHPTSLPSPFGVGDLGPEAYRFVDFLGQAHQTWWQVFPLGPSGFGGSPYQPTSAFGGNPLLISLEILAKEGYLSRSEVPSSQLISDRVQFDRALRFKSIYFRKAFDSFLRKKNHQKKFQGFFDEHRHWLEDYSLYCVLKSTYHGRPWTFWEEDLRVRRKSVIRSAKTYLKEAMRYHQFLQFQFFQQWDSLKQYAHRRGVGFIGDIPIFVAHDSSDVWAHPEFFWLDKKGQPLYVAGTPPDYFSRDGQRWGNPLYRWDVLKKTGYLWWMNRFRTLLNLVDAIRLDHFIGFERYWRIPAKDRTARKGTWIHGPSDHFFLELKKRLGEVQIIAEDLGVITEEVKALRDRFKFPGMKILQFAFGDLSPKNHFLPHNFMRNAVVYTGTHDNDTTVGWFYDKGGKASVRNKAQIQKEKDFAKRYMRSTGREIHWDMIRLAHMSVANTAIIPAQDLMGLGSQARMNTPGTSKGNWTWRMKNNSLTPLLARRLAELTVSSGRSLKNYDC